MVEAQNDNNELLRREVTYAHAELQHLTDQLWNAVGYNQDPIVRALEAFPRAAQRRSDTQFSVTPQEALNLRASAAELGPGRATAETLASLGVEHVDAEVIEPGQLHKTVTELWLALQSGQASPIIVFGSDRAIPLWAKDKDKQDIIGQVDAERASTARLLSIGGQGLSNGWFLHRAGGFDAQAEEQKIVLNEFAANLPGTELEVTEHFLRSALDEDSTPEYVVEAGYDPDDGAIMERPTGQVRRLGTISGREVILVHKQKRQDGSVLDTADTMRMLAGVAAELSGNMAPTVSYYTSATYKPSRLMAGIEVAVRSAQQGNIRRVVVPTYGYNDLSLIRGVNPSSPETEQIAGELHEAATGAQKLRMLLEDIRV